MECAPVLKWGVPRTHPRPALQGRIPPHEFTIVHERTHTHPFRHKPEARADTNAHAHMRARTHTHTHAHTHSYTYTHIEAARVEGPAGLECAPVLKWGVPRTHPRPALQGRRHTQLPEARARCKQTRIHIHIHMHTHTLTHTHMTEAARVEGPASWNARLYNGEYPGPTLRFKAGDTLNINLKNTLEPSNDVVRY